MGAGGRVARRLWLQARAPPPPPPSRTKWTRRVPHPVLIGHALRPRTARPAPRALRRWSGAARQRELALEIQSRACASGALVCLATEEARAAVCEVPPPPPSRTKWTRRVPHPVLIGHAVCLVQVLRVPRVTLQNVPDSLRLLEPGRRGGAGWSVDSRESVARERRRLCKRWCAGALSNLEYLLELNNLAGPRPRAPAPPHPHACAPARPRGVPRAGLPRSLCAACPGRRGAARRARADSGGAQAAPSTTSRGTPWCHGSVPRPPPPLVLSGHAASLAPY